MVEFLKMQYQLGKLSDTQLNRLVGLGRVTSDDVAYIKGGTNEV